MREKLVVRGYGISEKNYDRYHDANNKNNFAAHIYLTRHKINDRRPVKLSMKKYGWQTPKARMSRSLVVRCIVRLDRQHYCALAAFTR